MLINVDQPEECRAVVIENGKLAEIIVEHSSQELVKGNIYLGVVSRVEPAFEAAFVDFGGKKYGFLPFKDVLPESYLQTGEKKARTRIQDVLVRGQKLLVQVVKESRDAKGPSLTNAVTIPGRFLVLMVSSDSSGISRKIEDEAERKKMKQIMSDLGVPASMGVIIRTAGLGRTKTELQRDIQALLKIWENIEQKANDPETKAPCLLYEGPDMVVRTVRDHFSNDTTEVLVDNQESYRALKQFMKMVMPRLGNRVKLYKDTKPLFSLYNVEQQIESIYNRRVELPSGGSIVIDVGEAMVSIDVNSGRTTGASALEETAFKTNMEAAEEIARQLRLRDLGGLIVIDFIDMFQKKNKAQLEKHMKQSCKLDKARVNFSRLSRFGLLEMSRQRLSPPVKAGFFMDCTHCRGTGHVKTDSSAALSVIRKIQENLSTGNVKILEVRISTQITNYLLNHKTKSLMELEIKNGVDIKFETVENLPYENFSYTVLERKKEEDKVIEQKSRIQKEPRPEVEEVSDEKEASKEVSKEVSTDENKERRPVTGRGRGRRPSGPRRPGSKRPARSSRKRPWKSTKPRDNTSSEEGKSPNQGVSSTDSAFPRPESTSSEPSSRSQASSQNDSNEERQPIENVSRLHEVVIPNPRPYRPEPSED